MIHTIVRGVLCILGFPLVIWNFMMNHLKRVEPPGQLVQTNSAIVHTILSGEGPVTVVLEAGFSSTSIDWLYVQPQIARHAKVVSYDRGNYGWSCSQRKTQTAQDSVEELRQVLQQLDVTPPYILVGHSYGGLVMRLFASMYPDEVSGLLLEDSAHEHYYLHTEENAERQRRFKRLITFTYMTSWVGIPRLLKQKVGRDKLDDAHQSALEYIGYRPKSFTAAYQEYRDSETTAHQLLKSRPLRDDLPVIVISANHPSAQWRENQNKLAKLTSRTERIFSDIGHSVHLEKPDIVVQSTLKLIQLSKVQSKHKLNI